MNIVGSDRVISERVVIGAGTEPDAISIVGGGVITKGIIGAGPEGDAIIIVGSGGVIFNPTIISTIMPINAPFIIHYIAIPNSYIIITVILYAIGVACTRTIQSSIITRYNYVICIYLNSIRQVINARTQHYTLVYQHAVGGCDACWLRRSTRIITVSC